MVVLVTLVNHNKMHAYCHWTIGSRTCTPKVPVQYICLRHFTYPQTIFKPSVHHSSRFLGKLFGAIGGAVFVVGFGAAHNETLGVETNHLIVTHAHQS